MIYKYLASSFDPAGIVADTSVNAASTATYSPGSDTDQTNGVLSQDKWTTRVTLAGVFSA